MNNALNKSEFESVDPEPNDLKSRDQGSNELDSSELESSIDPIFQPLSEHNPTGVDVREDEQWVEKYYQLRDLRQKLRRDERYADESELGNTKPQWESILQQACVLLENASKDVEIATWLIEAEVRLFGFMGLSRGLYLLQQFITNFGDQLFPAPDPEEPNATYMSVQALSGGYSEGTLILPINLTPFLTTEESEINYWDYAQAQAARKLPNEEKQRYINAGKPIQEDLQKIAQLADIEVLDNDIYYIQTCIDLANNIETAIKEHTDGSTNLKNVRDALKNCLDAAEYFASQLTATLNKENEIGETANTNSNNIGDQSICSNLKAALHHMQLAYNYFKTQQPHSPIKALLKRGLNWAEKDLEEILPELIPDEQSRHLFSLITGVQPNLQGVAYYNDSEDRGPGFPQGQGQEEYITKT